MTSAALVVLPTSAKTEFDSEILWMLASVVLLTISQQDPKSARSIKRTLPKKSEEEAKVKASSNSNANVENNARGLMTWIIIILLMSVCSVWRN